tara:strand:- start:9976 stop:11103 length:1128 start_codon:yes stop_codon:yes gene_type:complete
MEENEIGYKEYKERLKSKQGSNKKIYIILFVLISTIIVTGYFLKDAIITDETPDVELKYIDIYHEVIEGNSIQFKLINNKYDTLDFDSELHNFFNLELSSIDESERYSLNDNMVYPCNNGLKYKYTYDTTFMEGQKLLSQRHYVEAEEFGDNFVKSDKAICKVNFKITLVEDPNLDNDCRFFVYTDHPDNLIDSSQIDTVNYTYFTRGANLIEISVTGRDGNYFKQNQFDWDTTLSHMNVWARSTVYPDELVPYIGNGMKFTECFLYNEPENLTVEETEIQDEVKKDDKPTRFDWKKFKDDQTKKIGEEINKSVLDEDWINNYQEGAVWKLDGQDITGNEIMELDMAKMQGKSFIVDVEVSKKGPKVNSVKIKSR